VLILSLVVHPVHAQGTTAAQIANALQRFLGQANTWTGVQTFSGGASYSGQVSLANGTVAAPSLTFTSELSSGIYRIGNNLWGFSAGGAGALVFDGVNNRIIAHQSYNLGWGSSGVSTPDLFIARDAANTLAQRNGTNAQKQRWGNTWTDINNYEYGFVGWTTNVFTVGTEYAGSGVPRQIEVLGSRVLLKSTTLGSDSFQIDTTGFFTAVAHNTYDIGVSTVSLAPRNIFAGTLISAPTLNATSAYNINGNAFAAATIGPSTPAGTTSLTLVMAGLAGSITTRTGRIEICMSGVLTDNTANAGTRAQISYGTGTAPMNGVAVTGTQIGPLQAYTASTLAAAAQAPYGACWNVTTLTGGTTYWFDTAFSAITGGTGSLLQASMEAHDIP
jgi:hypothetical protein